MATAPMAAPMSPDQGNMAAATDNAAPAAASDGADSTVMTERPARADRN